MLKTKSLFNFFLLSTAVTLSGSASALKNVTIDELESAWTNNQILVKNGKSYQLENQNWQSPEFSMFKHEQLFFHKEEKGKYKASAQTGGKPGSVFDAQGNFLYDFPPCFLEISLKKIGSAPLQPQIQKAEISTENSTPSLITKIEIPQFSPNNNNSKQTPPELEDKKAETSSQFHSLKSNPGEPKTLFATTQGLNGYFVSIERITKENIQFWREKLGWGAIMQFEKQADEDRERDDLARQHDPSGYLNTIEQVQAFFPGTSSLLSTSLFEYKEFSPSLILTDNKTILDLSRSYKADDRLNRSYLDAMRAFTESLNDADKVPVFISYLTESQLDKPISAVEKPDTDQILSVMTLRVSEKFYSPFGIIKDPVADASAQSKGLQRKGLALPLQKGTARLIGELYPNVDTMVVRPLEGMAEILKKSGVSYSSSNDEKLNSDATRMSIKYDKHGDNPSFSLYDPITDQSYTFEQDHWFLRSKFMGGQNDGQFYKAFPFYVTKLNDLAK